MDLVRLNSVELLSGFDCGTPDLNEFLLENALAYQRNLLGVSYLALVDHSVVAYATLLNDRINTEESSHSGNKRTAVYRLRRKMHRDKRLRSYPAAKIGRLAVATNFQRQGIGRELVNWLILFFLDNNKTGCRFLTVDALPQAVHFYESLGFAFLLQKETQGATRTMFLDLLPYDLQL